jgi:hypothetical protein
MPPAQHAGLARHGRLRQIDAAPEQLFQRGLGAGERAQPGLRAGRELDREVHVTVHQVEIASTRRAGYRPLRERF